MQGPRTGAATVKGLKIKTKMTWKKYLGHADVAVNNQIDCWWVMRNIACGSFFQWLSAICAENELTAREV